MKNNIYSSFFLTHTSDEIADTLQTMFHFILQNNNPKKECHFTNVNMSDIYFVITQLEAFIRAEERRMKPCLN